jgi:hypothetical protein
LKLFFNFSGNEYIFRNSIECMTCDMLSAWLLLIIQFLNIALYFQGYNQYYYISVDAELILACKVLIFLFLYFFSQELGKIL